MTTSQLVLQPMQLDALREVVNIASGHAATALGQLTGRRIMISVPEFAVIAVDEISGVLGYCDQPVVVVAMHVLGDMTASLVYMMPTAQAWRLCALLLGHPVEPGEPIDPLVQSSLMETANILGGAYAGALSTIMGGALMLSVPTFGIEPPDTVLGRHRTVGQVGLCIETRLMVEGEASQFGGHLLMLPSQAALSAILRTLQL